MNIYRFKFTENFLLNLFQFSKIHQYDHRKDFKEAWNLWLNENEDIVSIEVRRLTNLGYQGNVIDKMFKSARYYLRKKNTDKKIPIQRRSYVYTNKELVHAIDEFIILTIQNEKSKPSNCFDEFCKTNIELLKKTINIFVKNNITNLNEIKNRIKKTFKNRYFIIRSKEYKNILHS
jgi:hypothetical protein